VFTTDIAGSSRQYAQASISTTPLLPLRYHDTQVILILDVSRDTRANTIELRSIPILCLLLRFESSEQRLSLYNTVDCSRWYLIASNHGSAIPDDKKLYAWKEVISPRYRAALMVISHHSNSYRIYYRLCHRDIFLHQHVSVHYRVCFKVVSDRFILSRPLCCCWDTSSQIHLSHWRWVSFKVIPSRFALIQSYTAAEIHHLKPTCLSGNLSIEMIPSE
jgi:hypothetical protein